LNAWFIQKDFQITRFHFLLSNLGPKLLLFQNHFQDKGLIPVICQLFLLKTPLPKHD